jgi:hypothetical protein
VADLDVPIHENVVAFSTCTEAVEARKVHEFVVALTGHTDEVF